MSHPEVCVVYLVRGEGADRQVLLGMKRTGLGMGKVVAPGGKLEPGETPWQAARRELLEEVGIAVDADDLVLVGELNYPFSTKPEWSQKSWAFVARGEFGEPQVSAELDASWIALADVPYARMWDDAKYWLRSALEGETVAATFVFGPDLETVIMSDHPRFRSLQ